MARRIQKLAAVTAGLTVLWGAEVALSQQVLAGAEPAADAAATLAVPAEPAAPPSRIRRSRPKSSVECKVKSPAYDGKSPLRAVHRAIAARRPVRVVTFGTSSIVAANSARTAYPVRLENDLEGVIDGLEIELFARGQSGDVADGAAERMKLVVADIRPDLVVWQVGTNDAFARIDPEAFGEQLRDTLGWFASHDIDVVLIDPQYIERLAKDPLYTGIVNQIATVASDMHVLLVNRYDAMSDLAREHPGSARLAGDRFRLNDLGYRCMAEYAARAIAGGIVRAETENGALH